EVADVQQIGDAAGQVEVDAAEERGVIRRRGGLDPGSAQTGVDELVYPAGQRLDVGGDVRTLRHGFRGDGALHTRREALRQPQCGQACQLQQPQTRAAQ